MAITYPTIIDSLNNPSGTDTLDSPSHSDQHSDTNDAIEALEAKVGVDSSAVTSSLDYKVENMVETVIGTIYPVGAIYTSTLSTNPATLFGVGTWEAYAEGRVLVGKADSGTFDTAGATGGGETHTLTIAEMPAHSHGISSGADNTESGTGRYKPGALETIQSTSKGGGEAHNNLQPYVVVYMFKRTA